MRLIFPVMLILLGLVLVGFVIQNPSQRVDVTLGSTLYPDVSLSLVALVSLTVGVAFTAVLALIEGAASRLTNRRLKRELEKLRADQNLALTQTESPPPPDHGFYDSGPARPGSDVPSTRVRPASAPVYEPGATEIDTRAD